MDIKIVLLLVLGVSFLFFGCAGKKANPNEGVKYDEIESTEPDETVTPPPAQEPSADDSTDVEDETEADDSDEAGDSDESSVEDEQEVEADEETEALADLFVVDTDKPLEGEGFDVESPEQD